jgi:hypothetical protein
MVWSIATQHRNSVCAGHAWLNVIQSNIELDSTMSLRVET